VILLGDGLITNVANTIIVRRHTNPCRKKTSAMRYLGLYF
jgi:hypothetical protein